MKMKKKLYFPCVVLRPILISIPLALLLAAAIALNNAVDTLLKLYPLIIFSILAIIFTFVYFFRVVSLSKEEIKVIGPFSSKDCSIINEGKTLIITRRRGNRISIDLFGNNGVNADLDWLKNEQTVRDIYLFKSKVVGGTSSIIRILRYLGIDEADASEIAASDEYAKEYADYTVSVSSLEEMKEIRIKFTNTL